MDAERDVLSSLGPAPRAPKAPRGAVIAPCPACFGPRETVPPCRRAPAVHGAADRGGCGGARAHDPASRSSKAKLTGSADRLGVELVGALTHGAAGPRLTAWSILPKRVEMNAVRLFRLPGPGGDGRWTSDVPEERGTPRTTPGLSNSRRPVRSRSRSLGSPCPE